MGSAEARASGTEAETDATGDGKILSAASFAMASRARERLEDRQTKRTFARSSPAGAREAGGSVSDRAEFRQADSRGSTAMATRTPCGGGGRPIAANRDGSEAASRREWTAGGGQAALRGQAPDHPHAAKATEP